jgi:hypothetical protein
MLMLHHENQFDSKYCIAYDYYEVGGNLVPCSTAEGQEKYQQL